MKKPQEITNTVQFRMSGLSVLYPNTYTLK